MNWPKEDGVSCRLLEKLVSWEQGVPLPGVPTTTVPDGKAAVSEDERRRDSVVSVVAPEPWNFSLRALPPVGTV